MVEEKVNFAIMFKNTFLFRGDLGFPRGGCRTDKTRVWQKTAGLDGGREVEEKPFTSSLNIYPETCCRKWWGPV
jgi:hypothetical protein